MARIPIQIEDIASPLQGTLYIAGAITDNYGLRVDPTITNTLGISSVRIRPTHIVSAALTTLYNMYVNPTVTGSFNITNYSSVVAQVTAAAGYSGTITNAAGIDVISHVVSGGTITNAMGIRVRGITAGTNNYAIYTEGGIVRFGDLVNGLGGAVFNENGTATVDFRVESDTEANMLFLDANADTDGALYLGGSTNGMKVNKGGDTSFIGSGAGWPYGSFYCEDAAIAIVVAAANTYYPVTSGMTTGLTNNMTFQNNSELKCLIAGKYLVNWSMSLSAKNNDHIEGTIMINTTQVTSTVNSAHTPGAGDEVGVSGTGIITLAVNDIVRLCVENEADADDITVHSGNITLLQIGS